MTADGLGRREMLKSLALATTAAVAGAGCLSGGGTSRPQYADWVPATEEGATFAYLSFDITAKTQDDSELLPILLPTPSGGEEQPVKLPDGALNSREDPLLSLPVTAGRVLTFGGSFAFWTAGLGTLIRRGDSNTVDGMFVNQTATMGVGDFDTDRLDQRLRADDGPRGNHPTYESVEETESLQFYERSDDSEFDAPTTVAVSKDRLLLGQDRDSIERVAETAAGERTRAVETLDSFDWLTETVGDGMLVAGWHGPVDFGGTFAQSIDQRFREMFGPDDEVLVSLSLSPETSELTVDLAVHSDSLSESRRDTFETVLGAADNDTTVSLEDGQFSTTGTYDNIPFKPLGGDPTDDLPSGDDVPAKIDEAVPDGAIEFTEDPDEEGVYRVKVTKEIQVDELTIRAINADWELSTSSPNSARWIAAYPDPEDDEIRVTVTVDDVSAVIATKEVP